ncbi:DNA repair protein RecO [Oenococcus sp.]|uniref:DNA repair protein RecO n=1 Tax=Oenococcus sp. TaxID=1979414 RepID=UPI0039E84EEE
MDDRFSGIVIGVHDYSENDSLIRIISPGIGINTYLCRGSKKTKSQMKIVTQLFAHGVFFGRLPKNKGLGYLNSIDQAGLYQQISLDILLNAYASHIAELLTAAFEEHDPIDHWYQMLVAGLEKINSGLDPQIMANIFEIQLLTVFGVQPNLVDDPIDHTRQGEFDFSEKYNGILAKQHFAMDEHRLHADPAAIYYLRLFSRLDLEKIHSIKVSDKIKRSLQRVINLIYDRQIGLKTRARSFIEQMNGLEIKRTNND